MLRICTSTTKGSTPKKRNREYIITSKPTPLSAFIKALVLLSWNCEREMKSPEDSKVAYSVLAIIPCSCLSDLEILVILY
jgi:hypothetical protein